MKIGSTLLIATLISTSAFAEGLDLDQNEEQNVSTVKNETINISGQFSAPKKLTRADRLKVLRKRLEKQNEALVKKRVEQMRYLNEIKMMKKIQSAFDQSMTRVDQQI